jgi:hypothetical protein
MLLIPYVNAVNVLAIAAAPCSSELTVLVISSVELVVAAARLLTSPATTAKPRPASPVRAASIVAFKARRNVCSANALMIWAIPPTRRVEARKTRRLGYGDGRPA